MKFAIMPVGSHFERPTPIHAMRCTLLIPGLLPPAAPQDESGRKPRLPLLETLLARGDVAIERGIDRDGWLCRAFGVACQRDWPIAPLLLAADGVDPQHYYWLRADPVELRIERTRLAMAHTAIDLDPAETRALISSLNEHFARDGLVFVAPHPARWYLRAEEVPAISTTPLAQVLHRDIADHMPRGEGALPWHRVITEAQMLLDVHPVNAAREARGAAVANSVWLWGGGIAPPRANSVFDAVWGADALASALAASAGVAQYALPASADAWLTAAAAAGERHLAVLNPVPRDERLAAIERAWIAPLSAALRARIIERTTLVTDHDTGVLEATLAPSDRLRFWRRVRPL